MIISRNLKILCFHQFLQFWWFLSGIVVRICIRTQRYDVNAGNEEANEVDIRVVTRKRTMDFLSPINRLSRLNGVFGFVALWRHKLPFKQAAKHYVGFIALIIDIQLVFLIMIVSSPTRDNLSPFFNVYETGYYDLWRNYCVW